MTKVEAYLLAIQDRRTARESLYWLLRIVDPQLASAYLDGWAVVTDAAVE